MLISVFHTLDIALLCSCLFALRIKNDEQLISLSLLQVLAGLPLLAGQYFFISYHLDMLPPIPLILSMEGIFAVIWLTMSCRLTGLASADHLEPRLVTVLQLVLGAGLVLWTNYFFDYTHLELVSEGAWFSLPYGSMYFFSLVLLLSMLAAAWRMEVFWRSLVPIKRREYIFIIVGGYIVCAALVWAASYRITYLQLESDHFLLLSALMLIAWVFLAYATARYRLLNRRIFVSRKIVYSFVSPTIFAAYMLALGITGLVMKTFGLDLPFVLFWLALAAGLIAVVLFSCSGKLRRRVHFFISTHFYINKYEYRDEWLALSAKIQGAVTEADVARALYAMLSESFYTNQVLLWLGDEKRGYKAVAPSAVPEPRPSVPDIAAHDSVAEHLKHHPYLYVADPDPSSTHLLETEANIDPGHDTRSGKDRNPDAHGIPESAPQDSIGPVDGRTDFAPLKELGIVLVAPLKIGDQLVGIIGLGAEFTGGRYGHDDFDLLAALGTQTASALVAIRSAQALADERERNAWDRLSAFVLHDIKNAASMLSLVRSNAPENIHKPEFQQDVLEAIDDALARMKKVQYRLSMLKEEIAPEWTEVELRRFLKSQCRALSKRLDGMTIDVQCPNNIHIKTDPLLLSRILENLLLNTLEAGSNRPAVNITVETGDSRRQVKITFTDNGPGIPSDLLPDALFLPLVTTKPNGSGIGLWQVRQLISSLNGTIGAENPPNNGARFIIRLPF